MMDNKEDLLLWFIKFLIKSRKELLLIQMQMQMINKISPLDLATHQLAEELIILLLEPIIRNFKKEQFFRVLIKNLDFFCVLLIFIVNMLGLFL